METKNLQSSPSRRGFLKLLGTGAAALGLGTFSSKLQAAPDNMDAMPEIDAWFKSMKGKHKIVFDATRPHDVLPFAWPKVFQLTNAATGTPENQQSILVILRHEGIPYAFEDR